MTLNSYKNKISKEVGKIQKCEHEGLEIMYNKEVPINMAAKITIKMRSIR